jgi:hypothetical protein
MNLKFLRDHIQNGGITKCGQLCNVEFAKQLL